MPINKNTQQILNDLKNAGLDVSSLESQLNVNPLAQQQANVHLGGGILRQADYTRHMNDLRNKEQQIQNQVQQLATLHDTQNSGVQLPKETLDHIKAMEEALIGTGLFDEESIRNVSYQAAAPVERLINDQQQQNRGQQNNNNNNVRNNNLNANTTQNNNLDRGYLSTGQQEQFDLSRLIDVDTFQNSLLNMAYGGIATNLEINAHLNELAELGIKVDRAGVDKLKENLRVGTMAGKTIASIVDETFEVSKAREKKANEAIENRIKEETDRQVAERLKEAGVPVTKKFDFGRRHPILDRKRNAPANVQAPNGDNKTGEGNANNPPPQNLDPNNTGVDNNNNNAPVNKYGDTEIFRTRRGRDDRLQAASNTYNVVMEHYANDPTFVE